MTTIHNCKISLSGDQVVAGLATDVIKFDDANWDTGNWFNASTHRITPTVAGYYIVDVSSRAAGPTATVSSGVKILKNASTAAANYWSYSPTTTAYVFQASDLVYMNGSTDFFEFKHHNQSSSSATIKATNDYTNACVSGPFTVEDGFDMVRVKMADAHQSVPDVTASLINFTDKDFDTNNTWDTSSKEGTPQKAGWYLCYLSSRLDTQFSASVKRMNNQIKLNGNQVANNDRYTYWPSAQHMLTSRRWVYLNGTTDVMNFYVYNQLGIASNLLYYPAQTYAYMVGPFTPSSSFFITDVEITSDQAFTGNAVLNYDDEKADDSSHWDSATKRFTATVAGHYRVMATVRALNYNNYQSDIYIRVNSVAKSYSGIFWNTLSSTTTVANGAQVYLGVGDYIDILVGHNYPSNNTFYSQSYKSYVQVVGPMKNAVEEVVIPDGDYYGLDCWPCTKEEWIACKQLYSGSFHEWGDIANRKYISVYLRHSGFTHENMYCVSVEAYQWTGNPDLPETWEKVYTRQDVYCFPSLEEAQTKVTEEIDLIAAMQDFEEFCNFVCQVP